MRIVITVPHFALNIGRNESGLGAGFAKLGHEACIVTTNLESGSTGGRLDRGAFEGLPYRVTLLGRLPFPKTNPIPFGLRDAVRAFSPDLVHSSEDTDFLTVLAFRATRALSLPFVLSTERYYVPRFPKSVAYRVIERLWTQNLRRGADAVTTHSTIQMRYWNDRGLHRPDVVMIPVGVWTDQFSPGSSAFLRDHFRLAPDAIVGLTVGRMTAYKDYPTMMKAMRAVVDRDPLVHLVVVGSGPNREDVVRLARSLGLESNVHFFEARVPHQRMPEALRSADFYLQTSSVEPFGISAVEAMSVGRPVVVTDVGGMSDTVEHQVTGLKCAKGDHAAIAEAILAMRDPHLRAQMGAAGRKRAVAVFDWLEVCRAYLRVYEKGIEAARNRVEGRRAHATSLH